MKKITWIVSALLISGAVFGQQTKQPVKLDQSGIQKNNDLPVEMLKFDADEVDYGQINKGSDPIRVFKFTNTTSSTVLITSARGSCGCTVPTYPQEPLAPGATGEIKVRYDTQRVGSFKKTVTLSLQDVDGKEDSKTLTISGKVLDTTEPVEGAPAKEKSIFNN
jgi:hypothetical protein